MIRSNMHSRFIACVTLVATLFSAISPGLAATLLTHNPAALSQILGLPAAPEAAFGHHDGDHHAAIQHRGHSQPRDSAPRHAHDIYCSFCLNATSTLAVSACPATPVFLTLAYDVIAVEQPHTFTTAFHPLYRSRAPPSLS
jgi:hypothetical protein